MTFASTGVGSPPHLTLELLQSVAGVKFVHVPYRGAAPALTDLLGGQIQVFAADAPVLMSNIRGGKIRALGAASGQRNPMLPDVPTLAEQGIPGVDSNNWYALYAPKGTPAPVIARLSAALQAAVTDGNVIARFAPLSMTPVAQDQATPAALDAKLRSEAKYWSALLKDAGVQPE